MWLTSSPSPSKLETNDSCDILNWLSVCYPSLCCSDSYFFLFGVILRIASSFLFFDKQNFLDQQTVARNYYFLHERVIHPLRIMFRAASPCSCFSLGAPEGTRNRYSNKQQVCTLWYSHDREKDWKMLAIKVFVVLPDVKRFTEAQVECSSAWPSTVVLPGQRPRAATRHRIQVEVHTGSFPPIFSGNFTFLFSWDAAPSPSAKRVTLPFFST